MILEWFVGAILGLVTGLVELLPLVDPAPVFDIGPIIGMAKAFDAALPISEMIAGVVILLVATNAALLFGTLRQVWRFVPFVGGG